MCTGGIERPSMIPNSDNNSTVSLRRLTLRGASLVEMLIVFTIFTIIMVMVADMSSLALHSQVEVTDTVEARRKATIAMSVIRRELSTCRSLESPDPNVGTNGWWQPSNSDRLVLHVNRPGGTKRIDYWFDDATKSIWRSDDNEERPILSGVESFGFQQEPGPEAHILKINVKMQKVANEIVVWGRAVRV